MDVWCTTVYEGILLRTCVVRSPPEGERKGNVRAKLQKAHDSTNPSPPHVTPHPHRTVSCPISFTPSRPVTVTQPHGTSHSPAQRISTTSPCTGSRPVTIFTINGPGFACARTHARNRKKAPVVSRRAARLMPTAKSQSPPRVARANQTKPNQTAHDTHSHNRTHARPPTCRSFPPLSFSFSLAGRCVFALILAAASPRPPSQLAQSLSRPPHKYSPCLSSPLSPRERADERTSERGARRAGGGGAVRLGVSSPLLPTLPFLRPPLDSRGSGQFSCALLCRR